MSVKGEKELELEVWTAALVSALSGVSPHLKSAQATVDHAKTVADRALFVFKAQKHLILGS
jgi:hypothetical protein